MSRYKVADNNNDSYIVNVTGGLGNQMYCYAFYKKLCHDYPDKQFSLDITDIYNPLFGGETELFYVFPGLKADIADPKAVRRIEHKHILRYFGKGSRILRSVIGLINKISMAGPLKRVMTQQKYEEIGCRLEDKDWDNISYFKGFWQKTDFYIDIWDDIVNDFVYRGIEDEQNLKIIQKIRDSESVSIHVRRGDYSGDYKFDILNTAYYSGIIREILDRHPDALFFFFSNDSEYVRQQYSWLDNKIIVDCNNGRDSYKDMILMSECKTNIVANSTFSLWAAFLNKNKNRTVFYPNYYFRNERPLDFSFLEGFIKKEVLL